MRKKKTGKYIYYHCTGYKGKCPEKYAREEEVTRQVEAALKALKADKDVLALMIRALKESHADESAFHNEAVSKLQKERDVLESRIEALYLDKLDKIITPEFFAAKSCDWQEKLTDLRTQIDRHGKAHTSYINEGVELLELSQRALERYHECERAEKRRILNLLLSNSLWMNASFIPKYRQPFDLLAVMNGEDQNKIAPSGTGEGDLGKWWSQVDIVRTFFYEPMPEMAQIEAQFSVLTCHQRNVPSFTEDGRQPVISNEPLDLRS